MGPTSFRKGGLGGCGRALGQGWEGDALRTPPSALHPPSSCPDPATWGLKGGTAPLGQGQGEVSLSYLPCSHNPRALGQRWRRGILHCLLHPGTAHP